MLPICFGEATKIAGLLLGSRKTYETECKLGETTTTDDAEGDVIERRPVPGYDDAAVRGVLAMLSGRITQIPPIYSALKQGGVPLYRRARRGENVQAPPRDVDVYRFELLENAHGCLRLRVECGSGTYVRSLVRDLGARLGCGAHVTALRRLWVEPFSMLRMRTLEELDALATADPAALDACLLPLEQGLVGYPAVRLDAARAERLRQGQTVEIDGTVTGGRCIALDETGRAVALAETDAAGHLRSVRGFNPC